VIDHRTTVWPQNKQNTQAAEYETKYTGHRIYSYMHNTIESLKIFMHETMQLVGQIATES